MEKIGIIDLGSNSSRLVIYEIRGDGGYRLCYRMKKNIQLAEHITHMGQISAEGLSKAVFTTQMFENVGRLYDVQTWIAVATAAVRQVTNRDEVVTALKREAGLQFRVLTGEEEARYGYLGVINTMDVTDAVIVDIGGASTEVVLVRDRQMIHAQSIPYGALTLTKQFEELEFTSQIDAAFDFFREKLAALTWLQGLRDFPLVGIGGTIRAIGKMSGRLQQTAIRRIHGHEVTKVNLQRVFQRIRVSSFEQRKKLGDLSESRAKVIHTGTAIAVALADTMSANRLIVSGCGLREGLFYEHIFSDASSLVLSSVREHSVHNFMQLYHVNLKIAYETAGYAERFFEDLASCHKLSMKYKGILRASALLNTAGQFINVEKYAKHTDYILRFSYLYGFTEEDLLNISWVVLGKRARPFRQMHLMIQAAKFVVLERSLRYEDVLHTIVTKLQNKEFLEQDFVKLDGDFQAMLNGFDQNFNVREKNS